MRAVETSLIVRLIVRDNIGQSELAERIVANGAFVPVTVLQETAWVLASFYRLSRSEIAESLLDLMSMPNVYVAPEDAIRWALERFRSKGDIADLFHIASATDCDSILTFDRRMARDAAPDSPIAVELLKA